MRELVAQMAAIADAAKQYVSQPESAILDLDRCVAACLRGSEMPTANARMRIMTIR